MSEKGTLQDKGGIRGELKVYLGKCLQFVACQAGVRLGRCIRHLQHSIRKSESILFYQNRLRFFLLSGNSSTWRQFRGNSIIFSEIGSREESLVSDCP